MTARPLYYRLDGKRPVPCSPDEAARAFAGFDRRQIARSALHGGLIIVSTVFLTLDHAFGDGPPVLFETMVFEQGDASGIYQARFASWAEAEAGHTEAVAWA